MLAARLLTFGVRPIHLYILAACVLVAGGCTSESALDDADWVSADRSLEIHLKKFPKCHHLAEAENQISAQCDNGDAAICKAYVDLVRQGRFAQNIEGRLVRAARALSKNCATSADDPDLNNCTTYLEIFPNNADLQGIRQEYMKALRSQCLGSARASALGELYREERCRAYVKKSQSSGTELQTLEAALRRECAKVTSPADSCWLYLQTFGKVGHEGVTSIWAKKYEKERDAKQAEEPATSPKTPHSATI